MKHQKTVTVPEKTESRIDKITCDLCGSKDEGGYRDWGGGEGNIYTTTVELEEGYGYGDGGNVTTTEFDICPSCFKTKLIPWLKRQGANPTITKVDF